MAPVYAICANGPLIGGPDRWPVFLFLPSVCKPSKHWLKWTAMEKFIVGQEKADFKCFLSAVCINFVLFEAHICMDLCLSLTAGLQFALHRIRSEAYHLMWCNQAHFSSPFPFLYDVVDSLCK